MFKSVNFFAILIIVSISIFSCIRNKENTEDHNNIPELDINKTLLTKHEFVISDLTNEVVYKVLQFSHEAIIGYPNKITVGTKYILAICMQTHNVYLFDINGKFIRKIGSKGKGPGEYQSPRDGFFDINEEFVFILNYGDIYKYSIVGKYVAKSPSQGEFPDQFLEGATITKDNNLITFHDWPSAPKTQFTLLSYYNTSLSNSGNYGKKYSDKQSNLFYLPNRYFSYYNNSGMIWKGDTIYHFDNNLRIEPAASIKLIKSSDDFDNFNNPMALIKYHSSDRILSIIEIPEYYIIEVQVDQKPYYQVFNLAEQQYFTIDIPQNPIDSKIGIADDILGFGNIYTKDYDYRINSFIKTISYSGDKPVDSGSPSVNINNESLRAQIDEVMLNNQSALLVVIYKL